MFKKILFCTDFSENSDYAFLYALNLAKTYKAKLLIFHAIVEQTFYNWASPEAEDEMKAKQIQLGRQELKTWYVPLLGEFKEYEYLSSETGEGGAYYEIIQTARNESVDIIVMGTHGRTGLKHLIFGSTAENVVKKSPCPVLTVRLPKKQSM
jgi:nucleotide-binding universal stress UspA family protein